MVLVVVCLSSADFFNWNRVKLRYCDGASFSGDGQNQVCITKCLSLIEFMSGFGETCYFLGLLNSVVSRGQHLIRSLIRRIKQLLALCNICELKQIQLFTSNFCFQAAQLQFRGERIWRAAINDLKAKGMRYANQVLHLTFS